MPHHDWLVRMVLAVAMLGWTAGSAGAQASLNAMLAPFLTRYELPALAAAIVYVDPQLRALGWMERRRGQTRAKAGPAGDAEEAPHAGHLDAGAQGRGPRYAYPR